jgi:hypothetical protein
VYGDWSPLCERRVTAAVSFLFTTPQELWKFTFVIYIQFRTSFVLKSKPNVNNLKNEQKTNNTETQTTKHTSTAQKQKHKQTQTAQVLNKTW